jgi:hypothetical protein
MASTIPNSLESASMQDLPAAIPQFSGAAQPRPSVIRACIECRRRKIRCDRRHPCAYCAKNRIHCVYPHPHQESKTLAAASDSSTDVLARLRRLEDALEGLRKAVEASTQRKAFEGERVVVEGEEGEEGIEKGGLSEEVATRDLETERGKLVFERGEPRYVNNGFWGGLVRMLLLYISIAILVILYLSLNPTELCHFLP